MNDEGTDQDAWVLAGSFATPGGDTAATFQGVRSLSAEEFDAVTRAGNLLGSVTTTSPHQLLVQKWRVLEDGLNALNDERTEALDSRTGRASHAMRSWATAVQALPSEVRGLSEALLGEVPEHVSLEIQRLESGKPLAFCSDLVASGEVRLMPSDDGPVAAAVIPHNPPQAWLLPRLGAAVMRTSEDLHMQVLVAAGDLVDEATRLLRGLEAEVLLGAPLLLRRKGSSLEQQDLHGALRSTAQAALYVARDRTRTRTATPAASSENVEHHDQGLSPVEAAEAGRGTAVNVRVGQQGPEEGPWPAPPVPVEDLAAYLMAEVSLLEEAWSDALTLDAALPAVEEAQSRFGSLAAAMLRATTAADEAARANGGLTIPGFPLKLADIMALRPQEPLSAGDHAAVLPQLYAFWYFAELLGRLSEPLSLTVEPPNTVRHARFDPGDVLRLKAQAALVGRCSALASATAARLAGATPPQDHPIDAPGYAEAARRAFTAGLPEAVVLYAHLEAEGGAEWAADLADLLAQTVAAVGAASSGEELLAVTVPIAFEVARRLDELERDQVGS